MTQNLAKKLNNNHDPTVFFSGAASLQFPRIGLALYLSDQKINTDYDRTFFKATTQFLWKRQSDILKFCTSKKLEYIAKNNHYLL